MRKIHKATNKKYDSGFEEDFNLYWKKRSNVLIIHHHVLHLLSGRKWEIDFSFPDYKLAIELQGYGSGHTSYLGMQRDYLKHNDLILSGWTLLYFMSSQLKTEYPYITIKQILEKTNVKSTNITQERGSDIEGSNPLLIAARRLRHKGTN